MSLFVPPTPFTAQQTTLTAPATTVGVSVAAGTPAHTKNSTYTTLIASTSFETYAITIWFSDVVTAATDTSLLVDIAIGAAASETVIIPNLNAGGALQSNISTLGQKYWFPLKIPAGSRLSATAQGAIASDTVRVSVWLFGDPKTPVWAGTQVVDYGTNLAASKGVDVACGLSAAEGAWTEITAATTQPHYYLAAGVGGAADTVAVSSNNLLDLGVGAAAAEEIIAESLWFVGTTGEAITYGVPMSSFMEVASGERLSARISSSQASAQSYDCIFYGLS